MRSIMPVGRCLPLHALSVVSRGQSLHDAASLTSLSAPMASPTSCRSSRLRGGSEGAIQLLLVRSRPIKDQASCSAVTTRLSSHQQGGGRREGSAGQSPTVVEVRHDVEEGEEEAREVRILTASPR